MGSTYHIDNLPKGKWDIKGRKVLLGGKEALRIRVPSKVARKLRRAGAELIKP